MKWAFIYALDSASERKRVDTLGTLVCVGIPDVTEAPQVAKELVADGVELIELCGAFSGAGLAAVSAAIEGAVPVGAVFFGVEARGGLQQLFG